MSRLVPSCAWCGRRLSAPSMRLRYSALPGRPEVGWHWDPGASSCAELDPLVAVLWKPRTKSDPSVLIEALEQIEARGGGRLSATLRWVTRHAQMAARRGEEHDHDRR